MRFGLSTHLFHAERLTRGHFELIAASGFDLVELFATRTHFDYQDQRHVDEVKRWIIELQLEACSLHLPISPGVAGGVWGRAFSNASPVAAIRHEAIDETSAALDVAAQLGCASAVLHLGIPRGQPIPARDNDPRALRHSLGPILEHAAATGVRLALEVIPNLLSTPGALLGLLAGDPDLNSAGICLDLGHAHLLGGAADAAEALSGHVITTHVHDNLGVDDDHLVPFEGSIDWPEALMALKKTGFAGPLVFEVDAHGDAGGVLSRTVGARARLQAILDEFSAPIELTE